MMPITEQFAKIRIKTLALKNALNACERYELCCLIQLFGIDKALEFSR